MCLLSWCLISCRPKKHTRDDIRVAKAVLTKAFGQRVREIRLSQGLSQEALAHLAGIHRTGITRIESATRSSTLDTVEKLAAALKISPRELVPDLPAMRSSRTKKRA